MYTLIVANTMLFLSTLSLRRATNCTSIGRPKRLYFYPRSPCGERRESRQPYARPTTDFYPRSPCGERQDTPLTSIPKPGFLSTLSLRRATTGEHHANSQQEFLSTLSLRRATTGRILRAKLRPISIHALLAESDIARDIVLPYILLFLSTLSLRRATLRYCRGSQCFANFYPRSPCGERLEGTNCAKTSIAISIHALLAESDYARPGLIAVLTYFYPRSPCGERHFVQSMSPKYFTISIHALLAESDDGGITLPPHQENFYPRSPCGERRSTTSPRIVAA